MSGKAQTVMWLGILLVLTRLFTTSQWSNIWTAISTPGGGTASGGTTTTPKKKPNCSGLVGAGLWACQRGYV